MRWYNQKTSFPFSLRLWRWPSLEPALCTVFWRFSEFDVYAGGRHDGISSSEAFLGFTQQLAMEAWQCQRCTEVCNAMRVSSFPFGMARLKIKLQMGWLPAATRIASLRLRLCDLCMFVFLVLTIERCREEPGNWTILPAMHNHWLLDMFVAFSCTLGH